VCSARLVLLSFYIFTLSPAYSIELPCLTALNTTP
jgi:hypothetical protein